MCRTYDPNRGFGLPRLAIKPTPIPYATPTASLVIATSIEGPTLATFLSPGRAPRPQRSRRVARARFHARTRDAPCLPRALTVRQFLPGEEASSGRPTTPAASCATNWVPGFTASTATLRPHQPMYSTTTSILNGLMLRETLARQATCRGSRLVEACTPDTFLTCQCPRCSTAGSSVARFQPGRVNVLQEATYRFKTITPPFVIKSGGIAARTGQDVRP